MMSNLIMIEHLKMKRNYIFIILLVGSMIGSGLGLFLYVANQSVFNNSPDQALALWEEINLFSSQIFVPLFLAIVIGINIQLEKSNRMFDRLKTLPVNLEAIFISKVAYFAGLQFIVQLIGILMYLSMVHILSLSGNLNLVTLSRWFILGWIASIGIIAIQLGIANIFKTLTGTLLVDFGLVIGGFIVTLISPSQLYPFSQITIGLHAHDTNAFTFSNSIEFTLIIGFSILLGNFLFILSSRK